MEGEGERVALGETVAFADCVPEAAAVPEAVPSDEAVDENCAVWLALPSPLADADAVIEGDGVSVPDVEGEALAEALAEPAGEGERAPKIMLSVKGAAAA